MRMHARVLVLGAALATALLAVAPSGNGEAADDKIWQPILTEAVLNDLVKQVSDRIQADLKTGPPKEDDVRKKLQDKLMRAPKDDEVKEIMVGYGERLEGQALFVAIAAQSTKGDAQQLATLRDAGLKLQELLSDNKTWDDAAKLAASLPTLKADPKASTKPVDFKGKVAIGDVMKLFRLRFNGGLGFAANKDMPGDGQESRLISLAGRRAPALKDVEAQAEDIQRFAYMMAVIGQLAEEQTPTEAMKDKDPKQWKQWSADMRKEGLELAKAAKSKNPDDVNKAAKALHSSCISCHTKWRD